ncbi:MAG: formate--tetrahydrofolate ligase [Gammaproteobacteria bacterium]|nr:formate--tetrahydrofolate ligase [Gammaproteobacteria bacterium]MYH46856.1 formate--tetrahydrofolate ligase [Gammaproteobacteria bacterium]MYL13544.1 formate--tetrahydrofolate ligase [Gammaproteobacteria bacterium]
MTQQSDIEIAGKASLLPIREVAGKFGFADHTIPFGSAKAKVDFAAMDSSRPEASGKLILVTAVSPTPAGEGKTTTTIGLGDALNRIGKKAAICLREPSLGPCFGMKGGATGGGYAQVAPMTDINLHFTGDFHAIAAAHNLLAALIDNHIHWNANPDLDPRRITWRRVVDMNDRALRQTTIGLGGTAHGVPREAGFDITSTSEIMAVFCLAQNLAELQERLGAIVVGYTRGQQPVTARELCAHGAMTALLRDALLPNLVQTLENNPAFIHGGPFANIAHGCNSVIATRTALKLADYVVTEAGFGADLGAEKFFDIKCRAAGLTPDAAVLVATVKALKMHGGVARSDLIAEDSAAVARGCVNLGQHLAILDRFGVPAVVAINRHPSDTDAEVHAITDYCRQAGVTAIESRHWAEGSAGATELAGEVARVADSGIADFRLLYEDELDLWEKTRRIAQTIYGARDIAAPFHVRNEFARLQDGGYGKFPVCMAKTQFSFSTDPQLLGAPKDHVVEIREVRLATGAGFIVPVCGAIMTMPGLPRKPSAHDIRVDAEGTITGLS